MQSLTAITKHIKTYFELAVWSTGLVCLAIMNPSDTTHFSLCFFKWVGLSFCPGCGVGHSISWLMHGNILQSFQVHPLGIFALIILLCRIFTLIKTEVLQLTPLKQLYGKHR